VGVNIYAVFFPAEALNAASTAPIPLAGLHAGSCCPFVVRLLQGFKTNSQIRKNKCIGCYRKVSQNSSHPKKFLTKNYKADGNIF
jgi:hypothetical protein